MSKPPAGYSVSKGAYFDADGQGPYAWDGISMTLIGDGSTGGVGAMPQFGAIRTTPAWRAYPVSASGVVVAGPCVVKGFRCTLVGLVTATATHDALSATGTNFLPTGVPVLNQEYLLATQGGVLFTTGLYVAITGAGGNLVVLALPVEV